MRNNIIRSICLFENNPGEDSINKLDLLENKFKSEFFIQTKRICSDNVEKLIEFSKYFSDKGYLMGAGSLTEEYIGNNIDVLLKNNINFNLELSKADIGTKQVENLFRIINTDASKTFNFAYVFNNPVSSPYFPSANFAREGYSVGLQPTDLAEGCENLELWFEKLKITWKSVMELAGSDDRFLGIDSSIAPIYSGKGSFINFAKKLKGSFEKSVTTDFYLQTTEFIKKNNLKPAGLCGIMFPALEDFELAEEYEKGNFSIERNVYLSLHSGLGIDTYPVGIDEKPERIIDILKLVKGLSNKYSKPLSVRFVSDGKAKIGEKTDFQNQYLKDVVIRPL